MKILFLCSKKYFDTKMSRVRFHAMAALSKVSDFIYSGIGWDNYDKTKTVQQNIDLIYRGSFPDIVVAYKPLELIEFSKIKCPKCMTYNEMWDVRWTTKEILASGTNLVICHHLNDISRYAHIKNVTFENISHCAEKTIYKDYVEPKINDILFVGSISHHYPFRRRLLDLISNSLSKTVKCKILPHAGGDLRNIHGLILDSYAREINRSKITVTCSSRYKYRLGKYTEIPMCASLLAADLPNEDHDFFKKFMLVLDNSWNDDKIIAVLLKYVRNDLERNKLIKIGLELNKEYTQEKYAERFLKVIDKFLGEHK